MTIRAKLYYNHFDKEGNVDGDKQLASITLSKSQQDEKGFFMEVFIDGEDGQTHSTLIGFYPHGMILKTNCELIHGSNDTIFIRAYNPVNDENT